MKTWRSKFEQRSVNPVQVEGFTDPIDIIEHFKNYFTDICARADNVNAVKLSQRYNSIRHDYVGGVVSEVHAIDAELVERVVNYMSLEQETHQLVGQAKRHAIKLRPKAV